MIHSATTTLIAQDNAMRRSRVSPPDWPEISIHGKRTITWVPAPCPRAYARIMKASWRGICRRMALRHAMTIDATIAEATAKRTP
jgi:hypothetical protein